jgi:hypothetical protein
MVGRVGIEVVMLVVLALIELVVALILLAVFAA